LMNISCESTEQPEFKISEIEEGIRSQSSNFMNHLEYEIMAEISMGICLPTDKEYNVMIKISDFEITTSKNQECKNNLIFWNFRTEKPIKFTCPYRDVDKMSDVFVYLLDKKTPVCYWKGSPKDFMKPNPDI
jgi:hypothetical protein